MALAIKRAVFGALERVGYTVIPNWQLDRFPAAKFLARLFRLLEIDCVLDVGANTGQYVDFLRGDVSYDGKIISFEPIPSNVDVLRKKAILDPHWEIESYALGAEPGIAQFNVMNSSTFSSFLNPDHRQVRLFERSNEIKEQISVEVKTLDGVLENLLTRNGTRNVFLKMDTQGFDLEVARGAIEALKEIRAVQTEASVKSIYKNMPDFAVTIKTFQSLGFQLSGMFPTSSDHFPLLVEFDCVLVANRFTKAAEALPAS